MILEDLLLDAPNWKGFEETIATNLLGPMRLTTALLKHLRSREAGAIVNVSSGLAFVPRAAAPAYGASKAALHSWTQAPRYQLSRSGIAVVELIPPLVATNFAPGQSGNPHAMPLDAFITEAMKLMCADVTPDEVLVDRVLPHRYAEHNCRFDEIFALVNST